MKNILFLFALLAISANSALSQTPAGSAGDETDWFFHYDKAVVLTTQKKLDKACTSLRKAAELAIESLNEQIMLKRLLTDQDGVLRHLAVGSKNLEWEHIRKALETRDVKWLKEVHHSPSDNHSGHQH